MSATSAVRAALLSVIEGASLGVEIYDNPPSSAVEPFISFGADDMVPDDYDCIPGQEVTIRIDVWGRDDGALQPTTALRDQIYAVVHEAPLSLDDPWACVNCRVFQARTMLEPDGIGAHGILEVTVLVEDTS